MTAIMPIDEPQARGNCMGRQATGPRLSEAEHFRRCPLCGGYVDMRDRVWLDDHQGPLTAPGVRWGAVIRIVLLKTPGST
jgi:hypothetical protein